MCCDIGSKGSRRHRVTLSSTRNIKDVSYQYFADLLHAKLASRFRREHLRCRRAEQQRTYALYNTPGHLMITWSDGVAVVSLTAHSDVYLIIDALRYMELFKIVPQRGCARSSQAMQA